jgi:hypothetical protein
VSPVKYELGFISQKTAFFIVIAVKTSNRHRRNHHHCQTRRNHGRICQKTRKCLNYSCTHLELFTLNSSQNEGLGTSTAISRSLAVYAVQFVVYILSLNAGRICYCHTLSLHTALCLSRERTEQVTVLLNPPQANKLHGL